MRTLLIIAGLWCCSGTWSQALECKKPRAPSSLPNGATATKADMVDAMRRVRAFNEDMEKYLDCLQTKTAQLNVGAESAERRAALEATRAEHNAAVAELTGVANCFNDQLREFKASGGGGGKKAADCTEAMAAAAAGAVTNATSMKSVAVTETEPRRTNLPLGYWSYFLRRGGDLVPCRQYSKERCDVNRLVVSNASTHALVCSLSISYSRPNLEGERKITGRAALLPGDNRIVLRDMVVPENVPENFGVTCETRVPPSPRVSAEECKFRIVKPVVLGDFFPDEARRLRHEGPVIVEFTLARGEGSPTDVKVAFSSLYPELDEAALNAIRIMVMNADCGGQRHRLNIQWELKEQ